MFNPNFKFVKLFRTAIIVLELPAFNELIVVGLNVTLNNKGVVISDKVIVPKFVLPVFVTVNVAFWFVLNGPADADIVRFETVGIGVPETLKSSNLQNSAVAFVVHSNLILKLALLFADVEEIGIVVETYPEVADPLTNSKLLKVIPSTVQEALNISEDSHVSPRLLL